MADLTAGTVVGWRYEIERVLARGGMSTVYIARDKKFDVRIAIKVAGSQGASTAEMIRERFKREAKLANVLGREQQFVRVFDWGEVDGAPGQLFLAMDLVEDARELDLSNGNMHERLGRITEALRVVASLHRLGVIHRDLKPSNFLRAKDGALRLTDFGIAKQLGDPDDAAAADMATAMGLTGTGMAMGTPFYMPPEQFEDAKTADARADVYALGVMLFNALAGRLPFLGDNASQVLSTQMRVRYEGRPPPRPRDHVTTLPLALDQVAAKAIALDAAQRYPSVDEMIVALEKSGWQNLAPGFEGPSARGTGRANAATRIEAPRTGPGPADAPTEAFGSDVAAAPQQRDTTAGPGANRATTATAGVRAPAPGSGPRPSPPATSRAARGTGRPGNDDATLSTAPAPPVPPIRPRGEMGRGVVHNDGVQIPKVVWFVVGTLLVVGVGINVLPKLQAPPSPTRNPPNLTELAPPQTTSAPPAAETAVALDDLPDADRPDLALAERLHAAWVAKTGAATSTPEELLEADAGLVQVSFEAVRLTRATREGKEVAITEVDSTRFRYVLEGTAPARILKR